MTPKRLLFFSVMPLPLRPCIIHLLFIGCSRIGFRSVFDYRTLVKISNFNTVGRAVYHLTHWKHSKAKQLIHERRLKLSLLSIPPDAFTCTLIHIQGIYMYANNLQVGPICSKGISQPTITMQFPAIGLRLLNWFSFITLSFLKI